MQQTSLTVLPATDAGLVDAVVYGTSDADDAGLLAALGQTTQWDENENGAKDTESLQFDAATQEFSVHKYQLQELPIHLVQF